MKAKSNLTTNKFYHLYKFTKYARIIPGAMASAHVCASVPNFLILEWQSYIHTQPMFKEIIHYDGEWVKNSFISLPEKPGIGVEINEEGMK